MLKPKCLDGKQSPKWVFSGPNMDSYGFIMIHLLPRCFEPTASYFGSVTTGHHQADVDKALERLREGFAFVGLEEEWDAGLYKGRPNHGAATLSLKTMIWSLKEPRSELWRLLSKPCLLPSKTHSERGRLSFRDFGEGSKREFVRRHWLCCSHFTCWVPTEVQPPICRPHSVVVPWSCQLLFHIQSRHSRLFSMVFHQFLGHSPSHSNFGVSTTGPGPLGLPFPREVWWCMSSQWLRKYPPWAQVGWNGSPLWRERAERLARSVGRADLWGSAAYVLERPGRLRSLTSQLWKMLPGFLFVLNGPFFLGG